LTCYSEVRGWNLGETIEFPGCDISYFPYTFYENVKIRYFEMDGDLFLADLNPSTTFRRVRKIAKNDY
jgi:hypothetical protein